MTALKAALILTLFAGVSAAQPSESPGKPPEFDVASVKPSLPSNQANSNFPLGPGDAYTPNGGYFNATNFPVATYIAFAYKLMGSQVADMVSQLPGWATTERFDIQARVKGNPGKDEMRLMMRALLAERFKLAIHYETRQVPVVALVLAKTGKTGPQLVLHPADSSCPTTPAGPPEPGAAKAAAPSITVAGGFPTLCGGLLMLPPSLPGRLKAGGRNITMPFIANILTGFGSSGRPMVDRTGLEGRFDFVLEWTPDTGSPLAQEQKLEIDPAGPSFEAALREQLGLKVESQKGSVQVLVLDHVERPNEN